MWALSFSVGGDVVLASPAVERAASNSYKLTDNDLTVINGKKKQLIGKIQEREGVLKQVAEKQVDEFTQAFRDEDSKKKAKSKSA